MLSIRQLANEAQRLNRCSGVSMDGSVKEEKAGKTLRVRAFGPFCSMLYYIDGVECSYHEACAFLRK